MFFHSFILAILQLWVHYVEVVVRLDLGNGAQIKMPRGKLLRFLLFGGSEREQTTDRKTQKEVGNEK